MKSPSGAGGATGATGAETGKSGEIRGISGSRAGAQRDWGRRMEIFYI